MKNMQDDKDKKRAANNKSYKVIEDATYTRFFKALRIPEVEESLSSLKVKLAETNSDDGCFVLWEGSNGLACPFNQSDPKCLEGKACFERAPILFEERIFSQVTGKKYRLFAKQCPKTKRFYLYQHKVKDGIYEVFYYGKPQMQGLARLITKDMFRNRCICCQARKEDSRLEIHEERVMKDLYVRCKTCRSNFYVTGHPVVYGPEFAGKCPICQRIYYFSFSLTVTRNRIRGIYFVHCEFCKEHYVLLSSGFSGASSLALPFLEAEFPGLCGLTTTWDFWPEPKIADNSSRLLREW